MKKIANVLKFIMVLTVVITALTTISNVFAADFVTYEPKPNAGGPGVEKTKGVFNNVLAIVQVVGIGIAVIMLIVLAIKYISSAPNDKAEIKKHAVVYVVGAILLFASAGVIELLKNFAGLLNGDSGNAGSSTVTGHN